jgi:hypothetical protein
VLEDLERYESGELRISGRRVFNINDLLHKIIHVLVDLGYSKEVASFIDPKAREKYSYGNYFFSDSILLLDREIEKFEARKLVEVWGCWSRLKWIRGIT